MLTALFISSDNLNASETKTKEVTFISNMNCGDCQGKVETALKNYPGIISYSTDLKANTVTVKYQEEKTDEQKIKKAINDAGFKADKKSDCNTKAKTDDCSTKTKAKDCGSLNKSSSGC